MASGHVKGWEKCWKGVYWNPRLKKYRVIVDSYPIGDFTDYDAARDAYVSEQDSMLDKRTFRVCSNSSASPKKKNTKRRSGLEHCKKCRYHLGTATTGDGTGATVVHCNYMEMTGISRVKLHYDRIGKESLAGMTHGYDCTEFEPKAKKKRSVKNEMEQVCREDAK